MLQLLKAFNGAKQTDTEGISRLTRDLACAEMSFEPNPCCYILYLQSIEDDYVSTLLYIDDIIYTATAETMNYASIFKREFKICTLVKIGEDFNIQISHDSASL